jgi:hypothetical protein
VAVAFATFVVQGPKHAMPPVPQELALSFAQSSQVPVVPPLQQPLAHEVPSQMHWPEVASPEVSQRRFAAQPPQVAPAVPHEVLLSFAHASHVPVGPPLQQPFGHEVASHTHWPVAVLHSVPEGHAAQFAPLEPQEPLFSLPRASQVVPVQQPAHAPPPQVHAPIEHAWPPPHGLHAAPPVPHEPGP